MTPRRVLVTGGTGQLGHSLQSIAWPRDIELVAPSRDLLDLANSATLADAIAHGGFAAVINAAAYTAVDRAEREISECWRINTLAAAALAEATAREGIPLIHLSTDYVFDGEKPSPYEVDDAIGPLSVYGASKAAGEMAVRTANPRHVIVRTSWVVSAHGSNFIKTMLRLGAERDTLRVVADQRGAPTSAKDLAEALRTVTLRLVEGEGAPMGTFHITGGGETSWHELAEAVFAATGGRIAPVVQPISQDDYPTHARRPRNSRLAMAAAERAFGLRMRPWQEAVAEIMLELTR